VRGFKWKKGNRLNKEENNGARAVWNWGRNLRTNERTIDKVYS